MEEAFHIFHISSKQRGGKKGDDSEDIDEKTEI